MPRLHLRQQLFDPIFFFDCYQPVLNIIRAKDVPPIETILVEEPQPNAPYGIKGVGEIGLVPTAGAVAAALHELDGEWRTQLPMKR